MLTLKTHVEDAVAVPEALRGGVVVIGNFDGVHLGHQALLDVAKTQRPTPNSPVVLLTFAPHPRQFFNPGVPHFALTSESQKADLAAHHGAHGMIVLAFDSALAALTAEAFMVRILAGRLAARCVVIGSDFHFGKGRQGTAARLRDEGPVHGFTAAIVPPVRLDGKVVSSTAIRTALSEGRIEDANRLLGRTWSVQSTVQHGDKRGRLLGYPTANLTLPIGCGLRYGIYAVRASVAGRTYPAVASFGSRPTFDNGAPRLEVHLFDFAGDLYGQEMTVSVLSFIRPEQKFDAVEALIATMDADSRKAKEILSLTA